MKKIALLIVFLNFTPLFAQKVGVSGNIGGNNSNPELAYNVKNLDQTLNNMAFNVEDTNSYLGTPYGNPSFLPGDIYNNNLIHAKDVYLRYNAIADEIEVKESLTTPIEQARSIPKTNNVFATINKDKYIYIPYPKNIDQHGYFQVLFEGDNYNLLKKHLKKFYPEVKATTTLTKDTPASFTDRSILYIVTKDGEFFKVPKSNNSIIKLFENNKNIVKKYIKTNNLKLKNEKDLEKLIIYVDSLDN